MEAWQRFTLLDLLLLFPGYAMGAAVARGWQISSSQSPQTPPPWPAQVGVVELVLIGMVLGSVLAGLVVLPAHWMLRHRRTRLSVGEWLWLSPTAIHAFAVAGSKLTYSVFHWATPLWFVLLVSGLLLCSFVGISMILSWLAGVRGRVPCPWTDVFGSIACVLAGALVWYSLIVDPLRI